MTIIFISDESNLNIIDNTYIITLDKTITQIAGFTILCIYNSGDSPTCLHQIETLIICSPIARHRLTYIDEAGANPILYKTYDIARTRIFIALTTI